MEKVSDEAKCSDNADMHMEKGICLVIPLPVPEAWESGTHRNSTQSVSCLHQHHLPHCKIRLMISQSKIRKGFFSTNTTLANKTSPSSSTPTRNRKKSAEVASCAHAHGAGAAGARWESETWSRVTMAPVTICPAFLSLSGRGRNNWTPTL